MESIWREYKIESQHKQLAENIERDIVIVGGGISGILTAYRLTERGEKVTLIEAKTLYSGVTHNTTAHISALQGYLYNTLKMSQTKWYYQSQIAGLNEFERIINEHKIDCDFERVDDYLYTTDNSDKIEKEYNILSEIGANPEYVDDFRISEFKATAAFKLPNMAVFHPLKFLDALPKNFEIYENTRIIDVDYNEKILYTDKASIKAKKIIFATGFPIVDIPGWYFLKMYKSQSYAIAIEKINNHHATYQSELSNGLTFRSYHNQMIIGGLDHRTGRVNANDKFKSLEETALKLYPDAKVTHRWTANDCVTYDSIPYIGRYSKNALDIYVITGFNKWGMANAMIASIVIADLIKDEHNEYAELFNPQRCIFKPKQIISNMLCTVKNLILKPLCPAVKTQKSLQPDSGGIVLFNGKKKAVYKDSENNLYVSSPLCQHLKCQLYFNPNTKSWDCPCHGSRFDIYGNIIVCPSVKELENKVVEANEKSD